MTLTDTEIRYQFSLAESAFSRAGQRDLAKAVDTIAAAYKNGIYTIAAASEMLEKIKIKLDNTELAERAKKAIELLGI